jgi:hypothetical protein
MNTLQFALSVLDWLQSDPSHIVVAASVVAAVTPTPTPGTVYSKIYKIVDLFAANVFRAKDTGVTTAQVAEQVAILLAQKAAVAPAPAVQVPVAPAVPVAVPPAAASTIVIHS